MPGLRRPRRQIPGAALARRRRDVGTRREHALLAGPHKADTLLCCSLAGTPEPSSLATRVVALPGLEHRGALKKALQPVLAYALHATCTIQALGWAALC